MVSKQTLGLSLLTILFLVIIHVLESSAGKSGGPSARQSAGGLGGGVEFHLTCTVLVDGAPSGSPVEGSVGVGDDQGGEEEEEEEEEGDEEEVEARRRRPSGKSSRRGRPMRPLQRRKRSIRVKRGFNKVQLLCDIDNPKGREIAVRSMVGKKGGGGKKVPNTVG